MNKRANATRVGLRRGWREFCHSLKSPQDQGFYIVVGVGVLVYLWFNRNSEIGDTGLSVPTYSMPSILGMLIAAGIIIGPAYSLAMEREDGTLLRMKAIPRGSQSYFTGQLLFQSLAAFPTLLVILIPGALIFDDVMPRSAGGWFTVAWVVLLGLLATMPFGMMLGAIVPNMQKVSTWGFLPVMLITAISGIFFPVQQLWGWVQGVAQVFPVYWIGLGMRSAFLPDSAAAHELTGGWRTGQTIAVLAAWAVVGAVLAPRVLRRMANRQSGSAVADAQEAATQWVR